MITLLIIALQAFHVIDIAIWWLLLTVMIDMVIFS